MNEQVLRPRLKLSVLDQAPVSAHMTSAQALRNSVDLAKHADALGFHRYWVAEHHGGTVACAAPEVLIGPIAAATRTIRVGSGGVMLPHYSPFKVAESFSMLAGLFPGRIDLAVGRAPGTDGQTAFALQRDRRQHAPDDFPSQLAELLAYLRNEWPEGHPFARLSDLPGSPERPVPWLLGSSEQSGEWAAAEGLPYAFADFINSYGASYAGQYRWGFSPSSTQDKPYVMIGVLVMCAETDAEAERLASSERMFFRKLITGRPIKVPPVEEALAFLEADGPDEQRLPRRKRFIIGGPEKVRREIEAVVAEYQADEAMILTIMYDHEARRRSYELVARAFGLQPQDTAAKEAWQGA